MKNLFYFVLIGGFILLGYSCNSDDITAPEPSSNELREVTFKINNLTSETSDISNLRASLIDSQVKYLYYMVKDKSTLEETIVEAKTLEGTAIQSPLTLKLKKGNYRISLYASERPINIKPISNIQNPLALNKYNINVINFDNLTNPNQFHGASDFQVNDADIQLNIELKRPVGKVTLAISDLDKAPSEVQTLIPILVRSGITTPNYRAFSYMPYCYTGMSSGASIFNEGWYYDGNNTPYSSIYIDKSKFSTINESTPFDFYLPQTVNVDLEAGMNALSISDLRYDLYLQGSKTDKMEYQRIAEDFAQEIASNPEFVVNPNVVFMTCIKKGIVIKPNEQITIKGTLFKGNQGFDISVVNEWGNNVEVVVDQPM